jgi:preprotein translocase subunit SecD
MTGDSLVDARSARDQQFGMPQVTMSFNSRGAREFADITERYVGRQLALVLDNQVYSAPVIRTRIPNGQAVIDGSFTPEEARILAVVLRAGALPAPVTVIEERTVGPSMGADSIRQGFTAGSVGLALILIFMLIYYRFRGLAADVALVVTLLLVFAGLIAFNATLTLPGIAGIILTVGMAVDGNVLIYERMKEEERAGKTPLAALDAGFRKALVTILDSNITTLIGAVVLFYFGTGSVRGFGVTLSIGLVASVFSNVVVTRALLQIFVGQKKHALKRS